VKLLPDTHLLLWALGSPHRLSKGARGLIADPENELYFSVASIWEIVIKSMKGYADYQFDPRIIRRTLLDNGYIELPIDSNHAISLLTLPPIHKDPFDRLLIAQATVEGILLLTIDKQVARYPGPIRKV